MGETLQLPIEIPRDKLTEICEHYEVAELSFFSSILRDDFSQRSNVDFLYVLEPEIRWGFDIVRMEVELAAIVGRRVDLVSGKAIEQSGNWMRRKDILSSAEVIHVAA